MKKFYNLGLVVLAATMILTSCSIEKRLYTSGYHIDWKNNKDKQQEQAKSKINKSERKNDISLVSGEQTLNSFTNTEETVLNKITDVSANAFITSNAQHKNQATTTPVSTGISKTTLLKAAKTFSKGNLQKRSSEGGSDVPVALLYVLCFLIPWLAVGFVTDWDVKIVIYNLLWTLLCGIPGIIHAIIVVSKNA